jgi:hypothetical protein
VRHSFSSHFFCVDCRELHGFSGNVYAFLFPACATHEAVDRLQIAGDRVTVCHGLLISFPVGNEKARID